MLFKIFDKAQQSVRNGYKIPYETLRIEVKFTKMQPLGKLDIYTIVDLLTYELTNLTRIFLLNE